MRRITAVLLAVATASTFGACGSRIAEPQGPVETLAQLNAAMRDIGVCPINVPHADSPYITLTVSGTSYADASFGCVGEPVGADGFASERARDLTADDRNAMAGGPYLVGVGDNLWILSYDRDEKEAAAKIVKRLAGESRVVE